MKIICEFLIKEESGLSKYETLTIEKEDILDFIRDKISQDYDCEIKIDRLSLTADFN